MASNRFLYVCVFTGGMTTLAIELSATRLIGDVFGTSNIVWANVIGLMLLFLTIGYFIGGQLADRYPTRAAFYRILVWSAFLSAIVPLVARPVERTASAAVIGAQAGLAIGSFLTILTLFVLPVTLLGMMSPFAIRLAVTKVENAGAVAGRIYAVSTLGSLVGTFLPVLVLSPLVGTTRTFLIFAAVLYLVGMAGLWQERALRSLIWLWMPAVVVVLGFILLPLQTRRAYEGARIIYEDESAYNYIQVQEDGNGYRYLLLNEGQGIHSQWHPDVVTYRRTWSFFLTAPYFNNPPYAPADVESALVIGLAAGTIPRQHIEVYGDIPIDGIEIDPDIIAAGEQFFGMSADDMPSLTVIAQDGRYALHQLNREYSLVAVDAYRPPYIPWHLTTVEFFEAVRAHLADDGVVAINVGRTSTDRRLVDAMTATLLQVFPSVHAMDVPATFNTILVATNQPTDTANLAVNAAELPQDASALLRDALALGVESQVLASPSDLVFIDDHAPVELLVDSIVLNFLISGDMEQIR